MAKRKTLKEKTLDFVKRKGFATHGQIKRFMFETNNPTIKYNPTKHRGYYCSYFSNASDFLANGALGNRWRTEGRKGELLKKGPRRLGMNAKGFYFIINR